MAVTFRNRSGSWKFLSNAVKNKLDQMPNLAPQQAELEAHIELAEALANKQGALRAELQQTVKDRLAAEAHGEELRQRLAAAVQAQIGFKSNMLHEFGILPRKRRRNPKKSDTPVPEPAPAPTSAETPKP